MHCSKEVGANTLRASSRDLRKREMLAVPDVINHHMFSIAG